MFGIDLCEYMLLYMMLNLKKLRTFLCTLCAPNDNPVNQRFTGSSPV